MTLVQTTNKQNSSGQLSCPSCNALLPSHARFCGVCGKRIALNKQQAYNDQTHQTDLSLNNQAPHIATHINGSNPNTTSQMQTDTSSTRTQDAQAWDDVTNEDTIRMVTLSLKDLARWRAARPQKTGPES